MSLKLIIRLTYRGGVERVSLNDVGPRLKILPMDILNDIGAGEAEDIIVTHQRARMAREKSATEVGFGEADSLYKRSHCAIENEDALRE